MMAAMEDEDEGGTPSLFDRGCCRRGLVVGVGLLPQRSTPLVNRLGFIVDDIGKGSSVRRKRGGEPPLSPASGAQRM